MEWKGEIFKVLFILRTHLLFSTSSEGCLLQKVGAGPQSMSSGAGSGVETGAGRVWNVRAYPHHTAGGQLPRALCRGAGPHCRVGLWWMCPLGPQPLPKHFCYGLWGQHQGRSEAGETPAQHGKVHCALSRPKAAVGQLPINISWPCPPLVQPPHFLPLKSLGLSVF